MKTTIKLFIKFSFTSLSPDAQPISLGIVSDETKGEQAIGQFNGVCDKDKPSKSFYAEFSDFDINRCDDWVKKNIIPKTDIGSSKEAYPEYKPLSHFLTQDDYTRCVGDITKVRSGLKHWISKFSDYNIQFVVDCSYLSSMWIVDLLDQRMSNNGVILVPEKCVPDHMTCKEFLDELKNGGPVFVKESFPEIKIIKIYKKGLPILSSNICPITEDLNSLIAFKKGISIRDAFELDREELCHESLVVRDGEGMHNDVKLIPRGDKFNALYDAKVIKAIYNAI